jgi:hypothetical protein
MRTLAMRLVLAIFAFLPGLIMASPKSESEILLGAALPFAQKMLEQYGEFYPYGAAMEGEDGKIVSVAATTGAERPSPKELIELLRGAFHQGAREGKYRATALVYDALVVVPSSSEKSDAIAVALDHLGGYSVVVFLPYKLAEGRAVYGELFVQEGDNIVFAQE